MLKEGKSFQTSKSLLGHECGLARSRLAREHSELSPAKPPEKVVEAVESLPFDTLDLLKVRHLQENVLTHGLESCDELVRTRT